MSSHFTVERLSAYLDSELSNDEAEALETHLRDCDVCRGELAGLQRVVLGLRGLDRAAPPPIMGHEIERRVALERPPRGLVERLEGHLNRRPRVDPGIAVGFALVFAFAAILYLFADAVERRQTPIVIPGVDQVDVVRRFEGRVFERRDDDWWQQGLEEPSRRLDADSAEGRSLRLRYPWLEELLEDGGGVVLEHEGESLELRWADQDGGAPP